MANSNEGVEIEADGNRTAARNGMAAARARNISKSARRALDVLQYFGAVRRVVRANEIAHTLDLRASSAEQLLKTLVHSGYLLFDPIGKTYCPSPQLAGFASWLTSDGFWNDNMHRLVEAVYARTGATVTLTVRNEDMMRIVDVADRRRDNLIGQSFSLDTVPGFAFLAACEENHARRIIRRAARYRQLRSNSPIQLFDRIREIRRAGYAEGSSVEANRRVIAMALPQCAPGFSAVLGIADTDHRIRSRQDQYLEIMRTSASGMFPQMQTTWKPGGRAGRTA